MRVSKRVAGKPPDAARNLTPGPEGRKREGTE